MIDTTSLKNSLTAEWQRCGICAGDTVLLHSDLRRLLLKYRNDGLTVYDILQSFLNALGPQGTLLLPLCNFDFCHGGHFDLRATQYHMGALTNDAIQQPGAVRTCHPVYSVCALGYAADAFKGINNFSAYGADSPFAMLREMNGKIAVLDLPDQHSMIFYHHVEDSCGVSYRYHKDFRSLYTDEDGATNFRTYRIYVRDVEHGVLTHVDPMGELLWEAGCYHGDLPHQGCGLRTISACECFSYVSRIIKNHEEYGKLFIIDPEYAQDHPNETNPACQLGQPNPAELRVTSPLSPENLPPSNTSN